MSFKFWKWRIEVKIKRLDADERIAFLAQELLKSILDSGRSVTGSVDNVGYLAIWLHQNGSNKIESAAQKWEVPFELDVNWQKESQCANTDSL